uniref:Orf 06150 protein n=1 Tax=Saccharomyces cerevisiae TaxID=4932 RepID=E9PA91_YEASX|nr:orf 06150 [Saccharomyces cerevisiae]
MLEGQTDAGDPNKKYFIDFSLHSHNLTPTFKVGHCQADEAIPSNFSGFGTKALLVAIIAEFNCMKFLKNEVFGYTKSSPCGNLSFSCVSIFHQVLLSLLEACFKQTTSPCLKPHSGKCLPD